MKPVTFLEDAFEQFIEWSRKDKNVFDKINTLIQDISRDYFKGLGKPEPLKHQYSGYWSRRINDEHRLIYYIKGNIIHIVSLKGHYV